jgi:hypothetical protein
MQGSVDMQMPITGSSWLLICIAGIASSLFCAAAVASHTIGFVDQGTFARAVDEGGQVA